MQLRYGIAIHFAVNLNLPYTLYPLIITGLGYTSTMQLMCKIYASPAISFKGTRRPHPQHYNYPTAETKEGRSLTYPLPTLPNVKVSCILLNPFKHGIRPYSIGVWRGLGVVKYTSR